MIRRDLHSGGDAIPLDIRFGSAEAALLDVMQVSSIIKVLSPDTFERPIYAGNAIQTVQATDAKKVIMVRTAAFPVGEGALPQSRLSALPDDRNVSSFTGQEAPIFQVVRYGLVGGLFQILPELKFSLAATAYC